MAETRSHLSRPVDTRAALGGQDFPFGCPPSDHELIRNTLARYSYAMDDKDWHMLATVFTEDILIHYPEPMDAISGLANVTMALQSQVGHLITQHSLTTQGINITGELTADVRTYGRAIHFGVGTLEGQSVTVWGKYDDALVKILVDGRPAWRISKRRITFQGPFVGNRSLLGV